MTCDGCKFGKGFTTRDGMGRCYRYPPQQEEKHPYGGVTARWPAVSQRDWCGEFQPLTPQTSDRRSGDTDQTSSPSNPVRRDV